MAQQKYQDSVSTLFDILFTPKKKGKPPKPPKLDGVAASDVIASGFVEALTNPAVYTSEALLTPIDEATGALEFGKVTLSKKYKLKSKVTLKNASGFILNPTASVDKMYKTLEARNKKSKAERMGGAVDAILGIAWAKKNGMSMSEAIATGVGMSDPGSFKNDPRSNVFLAHTLGTNAMLRAHESGANLTADQRKSVERGLQSMFRSGRLQGELNKIRRKYQSQLSPGMSDEQVEALTQQMHNEMSGLFQERIGKIAGKSGLSQSQTQAMLTSVLKNEGRMVMGDKIFANIDNKDMTASFGDVAYRDLQAKQNLLKAREKERLAAAETDRKKVRKLEKEARKYKKAAAAMMAWGGINGTYESTTALPQVLANRSAEIDKLIGEMDPATDGDRIAQLQKLKKELDQTNKKFVNEVFGRGAWERDLYAGWRAGDAFNEGTPISHKAEKYKREAFKKQLEAQLVEARHHASIIQKKKENIEDYQNRLSRITTEMDNIQRRIREKNDALGNLTTRLSNTGLTDTEKANIQRQIDDIRQEVSDFQSRVDGYQENITRLTSNIEDANKMIKRSQARISAMGLENEREFEDIMALKLGAVSLMPSNRAQRMTGRFKSATKGIALYQGAKKWTNGELAKKWMSGELFDDADPTAPGSLRDVRLYNGKGGVSETKVIMPNEVGNGMQVRWKKFMVGTYYAASPFAFMNTWFVDGSGFAYKQAVLQQRMMKSLLAGLGDGPHKDEILALMKEHMSDKSNFDVFDKGGPGKDDPLAEFYKKNEDGEWELDEDALDAFLADDSKVAQFAQLYHGGLLNAFAKSKNPWIKKWAKRNRRLLRGIKLRRGLDFVSKWTTRLPVRAMEKLTEWRKDIQGKFGNLLDKLSGGRLGKTALGKLVAGKIDLTQLQALITKKIVQYITAAVASVIPVIGTIVGYLLAPLVDKLVGKTIKEGLKIYMFLMATAPLALCFCITTFLNPEKQQADPYSSILPEQATGVAEAYDISSCYLHVRYPSDPRVPDFCGEKRGIITKSNPYQDISGPGALDFFPRRGQQGRRLKFSVDVVDGASVVLYNTVIADNPGQKLGLGMDRSCGTGKYRPQVGIQRLPPGTNPLDWSKATTFVLPPAPVYFDRMVTPGYYRIFTAKGTPCFFDNAPEKIIDLTDSDSEYCGRVVYNSNMPGGDKDRPMSTDQCGFGLQYDTRYNNACGGLYADCASEGGCDKWRHASLPGLALYRSIFDRDFTVPASGSYDCSELFPSVNYEVSCDPTCGVKPEVSGMCPLVSGFVTQNSCGQYSHRLNHGTDIATTGEIVAPSAARIVKVGKNIRCDDANPNSSMFNRGGQIVLQDGNGNIYNILHIAVDPSILAACGVVMDNRMTSCNLAVSRGRALGTAQDDIISVIGAIRNPCWTGTHYHIDIKNSAGQYVDSTKALSDLGCPF